MKNFGKRLLSMALSLLIVMTVMPTAFASEVTTENDVAVVVDSTLVNLVEGMGYKASTVASGYSDTTDKLTDGTLNNWVGFDHLKGVTRYVKFDMGAVYEMNTFKAVFSASNLPTSVQILVSDDNANWTLIHEYVSSEISANNGTFTANYTLSESVDAQFVMFSFYKASGITTLSEVEVYGNATKVADGIKTGVSNYMIPGEETSFARDVVILDTDTAVQYVEMVVDTGFDGVILEGSTADEVTVLKALDAKATRTIKVDCETDLSSYSNLEAFDSNSYVSKDFDEAKQNGDGVHISDKGSFETHLANMDELVNKDAQGKYVYKIYSLNFDLYEYFTDDEVAKVFENYKKVIKGTLKASNNAVPKAPVVESFAGNWINLTAVNGYEYSIDGKEWGKDPLFVNLEPATEYTLYQRVAETAGNEGSVYSALEVTTSAEAGAKLPVIDRNLPAILETAAGRVYTLDVSIEAVTDGEVTYQWYKDGAKIDGATKSSYDITPSAEMAGLYKVVITNTFNGTSASVASDVCEVTFSDENVNLLKGMAYIHNVTTWHNTTSNEPGNSLTDGVYGTGWGSGDFLDAQQKNANVVFNLGTPTQFKEIDIYTYANNSGIPAPNVSILIKENPDDENWLEIFSGSTNNGVTLDQHTAYVSDETITATNIKFAFTVPSGGNAMIFVREIEMFYDTTGYNVQGKMKTEGGAIVPGEPSDKLPETVASGKCGDNLTWSLLDDGTLTVSGEGAMADYDNSSNLAPWYEYKDLIKTVIIEDGATTIGDYAFKDCASLESVEIPEGVTSIGYAAFRNCDIITAVELPESVTSIGTAAFKLCYALESINLPDSIESIGYAAFGYCESLAEIKLPANITEIDGEVFYGCISLTTISIPNGVTRISDHAFKGCTSLASIEIPVTVTSIGKQTFNNCNALTDVYYYGTKDEWNAITIGENNDAIANADIHCSTGIVGENLISGVEWTTNIADGQFIYGNGPTKLPAMTAWLTDGNYATDTQYSSTAGIVGFNDSGYIEFDAGKNITFSTIALHTAVKQSFAANYSAYQDVYIEVYKDGAWYKLNTPADLTYESQKTYYFASSEAITASKIRFCITGQKGLNITSFTEFEVFEETYNGLADITLVMPEGTVAVPNVNITNGDKLTVANGDYVTLEANTAVTGEGGTVSYQWYKDETLIAGATYPFYNIFAADESVAGTYKVLASNNAEMITAESTDEITVTVDGEVCNYALNKPYEWTDYEKNIMVSNANYADTDMKEMTDGNVPTAVSYGEAGYVGAASWKTYELSVDLGEKGATFHTAKIVFMSTNNSGIKLPSTVKAYYRNTTEESWTEMGTWTCADISAPGIRVVSFKSETPVTARYVKFSTYNSSLIFASEVMVMGDPVVVKAPVIEKDLSAEAKIFYGDTKTLEVLASASDDGELTYQWYKDDTAIADATENTYIASESGKYYVVVTNTLNGKSAAATSKTCVVTVDMPSADPLKDSLQFSKNEVGAGETFVMTFKMPETLVASSLGLKVLFDNTAFEITNIAEAPYTDMQPYLPGCNNAGNVMVSYCDPTYDANTTITEGTVLLEVTFKVKADAELGNKAFEIEDWNVTGPFNDVTYEMDYITPEAGDWTKPVKVVEKTGYNITGTVKAFGDTAADMTIELINNGAVVDSTTVTGNSGTYSFESVAAGNYTIKASKSKHTPREYEIEVVDADITQDILIWLYGDVTGEGIINNTDIIQINRYNTNNTSVFNQTANADYRFKVANVTAITGTDNIVNNTDIIQINRKNANLTSVFDRLA